MKMLRVYHLVPLVFTPAAIGIMLTLIFSRTLPAIAGETLTLVSNNRTQNEIQIIDLSRGLTHTVARSRSLIFRSLAWSPNSHWLAYVTEAQQGVSELVVVSLDDHHRFRLAGRGIGQLRPTWSPDGEQLAFIFAGRTFVSRQSDIYLLDVRCAFQLKPCQNPMRNLTDTPANEREPTWSPDGKHIAFVTDQDGQREIYVRDIDGSSLLNLTRHRAEDFSPAWSPDGKQIAFVSDRARNYEIFVMDADTGDNVRNVSHNRAEEWSPAWSPDGKNLTFISDQTGSYQVYLLTLDNHQIRNLTRYNSNDFSPAWSPDGKQIAFVSSRSEFQGVYLLNVDCEDCIYPVTTLRGESSSPTWRP